MHGVYFEHNKETRSEVSSHYFVKTTQQGHFNLTSFLILKENVKEKKLQMCTSLLLGQCGHYNFLRWKIEMGGRSIAIMTSIRKIWLERWRPNCGGLSLVRTSFSFFFFFFFFFSFEVWHLWIKDTSKDLKGIFFKCVLWSFDWSCIFLLSFYID